MLDPLSRLSQITRPRVLIDAARAGTARYHRRRDLPRCIGTLPGHAAAMMMLFDREAELEDWRQAGAAHYRPRHHVAAMTALLAEAQILKATGR
jgi:hypothetical protein